VRRFISFVLAGIAVTTLATGASSGGPPVSKAPEGKSAEIQAREKELAELQEQISQLSAQLEDAEVRVSGLEGAIEKVGLERRIQERRVQEADAERQLAAARVSEAERRLEASEAQLATERARLEERLTGLYRLARHGHARLVFSIDPRADPLPAVRLLRYLVRRDASSVERFVRLGTQLAQQRVELDGRRAEAAAWYSQQTARRDELARLEQRQTALLAGVRLHEKQLATQALELADRETQLAGLLDTLYGREKAPLAGRSMLEFRGLLDWPVKGRLTGEFGPRLDPRYRTRVPHNGVDLETRQGDAVVAVYPGRVAYAADFSGYGPTVVLAHAGQVFTLYAGLASTLVRKGELVSLGQRLGSAGSSLYFEIRVENRPEDPRRWIR